MKTFLFNVQSKGGAGKSMLTYLQALHNEENKNVLFVDLDSSTKTSIRQLKFLASGQRIAEINLLDHNKKIDREKLFEVMESLNQHDFETFYLDFGAPESQQLPAIFTFDFTVEQFKEFETYLDAKFLFNIILAGGPSFSSCIEFTDQMIHPLGKFFDCNLYLNEYTFQGQPTLINEIEQYAEKYCDIITCIKRFGNFATDRTSGQKILQVIRQGQGISGYKNFVTKTIIKREIEKV
jgi:hypothetical protein